MNEQHGGAPKSTPVKDVADALPMQQLSFEEVQKNPALLHGDGQAGESRSARRAKTSNSSTLSKDRTPPRKKRTKNVDGSSKADAAPPPSHSQPAPSSINGQGVNGLLRQPETSTAQKVAASASTSLEVAVSGPEKASLINGGAVKSVPKGPRKNARRKPNERESPSIGAGQLAKERDVQRSGDFKRLKTMNEFVEKALKIEQINRDTQAKKQQALLWSQTGRRVDVDQVESLGRQMQGLWQSTRLTPAQEAARMSISRDVETALERRWPGCGLHVVAFGSTSTGLIEADSDVDLCLIDPTRPLGVGTPSDQVIGLPEGAKWEPLRNTRIAGMSNVPDYYSVKLIKYALEHFLMRSKFGDVEAIFAAVPIVKFKHRLTRLDCDLNVNDTFGLYNSHMIREYIAIAPAIMQPFLFTVKKWASQREINDPSGKSGTVTFNSYTVVLFALQYLQTVGLVPNLQESALIEALKVPRSYLWQRPKGKSVIAAAANTLDTDGTTVETASAGVTVDVRTGARKFDVTFARLSSDDDVAIAEDISVQNPKGRPFQVPRIRDQDEISVLLGTLLIGFFDWLNDFDFDLCGISLREGHPIRRSNTNERADQSWPYVEPQDPRWTEHSILCQDPFITDRNTSSAVAKKGFVDIRREVRRAHDVLKGEGEGLLIELLMPRRGEKLSQQLEVYMSNLNAEESSKFEERLAKRREQQIRARQSPATG